MCLLQAAKKLQQSAHIQGEWTSELQNKYEQIDKAATDIMLKGEQICTPKYPSMVQWSTKLLYSGLQLRYYLLYRSYLLGKNITSSHLTKLAQKAGIQKKTTRYGN